MSAGKVALQRGPIVCCVESADNNITPLERLELPRSASLTTRHEPDLLGGITVIEATARSIDGADWGDEQLYRTAPPQTTHVPLRAIATTRSGTTERRVPCVSGCARRELTNRGNRTMTDLATMSSVCPDWTLKEVVEGMKRHGYKGFEPRVEWGHASGVEADMSADARAETKRSFADEGLEICCIATGVRMAAPDESERAQHIEDLRRYIELAADLGCPFIRTFGGQRAGGELSPVVEYTAAGYAQIVDEGSVRRCDSADGNARRLVPPAPVRAVVEMVNHDREGQRGTSCTRSRVMERPAETFANLGDITLHTHAHDGAIVDGRMQVGALGEGIIDHATPLKLLEEAGFSGYFSVEVIRKPGSDHDADGVLANYAEVFNSYHSGWDRLT